MALFSESVKCAPVVERETNAVLVPGPPPEDRAERDSLSRKITSPHSAPKICHSPTHNPHQSLQHLTATINSNSLSGRLRLSPRRSSHRHDARPFLCVLQGPCARHASLRLPPQSPPSWCHSLRHTHGLSPRLVHLSRVLVAPLRCA
jgi:hypothetical protein